MCRVDDRRQCVDLLKEHGHVSDEAISRQAEMQQKNERQLQALLKELQLYE